MHTPKFSPSLHLCLLASLGLMACNTTVTPELPTRSKANVALELAFSPDGEHLAAAMTARPDLSGHALSYRAWAGLYAFDLQAPEANAQLLQENLAPELMSRLQGWSPDSQKIAYTVGQSSAENRENFTLKTLLANVSNAATQVLAEPGCFSKAVSWSAGELLCLDNDESQHGVLRRFDGTSGALLSSQTSDKKLGSEGISFQSLSPLSANQMLFKVLDVFEQKEEWGTFERDNGKTRTVFSLEIAAASSRAVLSPDKSQLTLDKTPYNPEPGPLLDRFRSSLEQVQIDTGAHQSWQAGFAPSYVEDTAQWFFLRGNDLMRIATEGGDAETVLSADQWPTGEHIQQFYWHAASQQLWIITSPDQKQLFTGGGKTIDGVVYGQLYNLSPAQLQQIKLYQFNPDTGKRTEKALPWQQIQQKIESSLPQG